MAQLTKTATILLLNLTVILLHQFISGVTSTTFTLVNKCQYTVWPGILSNAGVPQFPTTGFALQNGQSKTLTAPSHWGGRFWGRTQCSLDPIGKFSCLTGDCGSGKLECSGSGAIPPATLAEFTLNGHGDLDFYDVSLVDGYNLPMLVVPEGGKGQNCTTTGCVSDLNGACPNELKVMAQSESVACKSACEAFGSPEYCCSGEYGSPSTCKPSSYAQIFKSACPSAYSYAYDDLTSTFTCASNSVDYTITFCPSPNGPNTSQKASQDSPSSSTPFINGTMVYEGATDTSGMSPSRIGHVSRLHAIVGVVSVAALVFWQFL